MKIKIQNESFVLHSSGTVYWEIQDILIISDVHLGKVSHFRKHGIAIPQNAVNENFKRLTNVIEHFCPKKIIFLGDLFHSSKNTEWNLFKDWVNSCQSELILVAGNHDIIDEKHYTEIGISVVQLLEIEDFFFTHHPSEKENLFNFSGHIHPGITLRGLGNQSLKLPCFYQTINKMILPAFGAFTGKFILKPTENDIIYAIAGNEVIQISKKDA